MYIYMKDLICLMMYEAIQAWIRFQRANALWHACYTNMPFFLLRMHPLPSLRSVGGGGGGGGIPLKRHASLAVSIHSSG